MHCHYAALLGSLFVACIALFASLYFDPTFRRVELLGSMRVVSGALAGFAFAGTALGQACQTTTLQTSVPTNGSELALVSYSYCGGILNASAYIANLDYD